MGFVLGRPGIPMPPNVASATMATANQMNQQYNQMKTQCLPALKQMKSYSAHFQLSRKAGVKIDEVVLHDTGSGADFEGSLKYLSHPKDGRNVSIHYLIGREFGQLYSMVPEAKKANQASNHNSRSIGIEMYKLKTDIGDFTDWQYTAVSQLVFDICIRRGILRENIISHASIEKSRSDPRKFNWKRSYGLLDELSKKASAISPSFRLKGGE